MARAHGRILASIWDDPDFLALTSAQQRMYLFLISQPNLNHAGLLPLTIRRWSSKASELTPAEIRRHLAALEAARFVLVDEDTEELLIRTFVRNDGVWRMPKVMGAMVSGAQEISSRELRRALLAEIDRIPLHELSDEPGPRLPSVRHQIQEHIATLRRAFGPTDPHPSNPLRNPSGTPSDTPAEAPTEGVSEGAAEPSTRAHDARGHAGASRAPSPAPAPTPAPEQTGGAGTNETEPPVADADKPRGTPKNPAKHETADQLAAAFWEHHKQRTAQSFIAIRGIVRTALANGLDRDDVARALDHLAREGRAISGGTLTTALGQLRQPVQGAFLTAIPGGADTTRPLPGTDTTVAGWLALAEQAANQPQEKHA